MLQGMRDLGLEFRNQSEPTKMVVISDGDIARNKVGRDRKQFSPLGFNEFDKYLFANKDLLVNTLEYLINEQGVIQARGKEVKLRLLNTVDAQERKSFWQFLNIGVPLLFLALFGFTYHLIRRRRFAA
jgi:hypothetical protein